MEAEHTGGADLRREVADLWRLGSRITRPVRDLGRDVTVAAARTGLERALDLPSVRAPVERAAQAAAQRLAVAVAEQAAGQLATAAGANAVTGAAYGVTATALAVAGQAAGHPLSKAARRLALRNPLTRATASTWVGITERAAGSALARTAVDAALDSVTDVVADVVMDVVIEVGPELALEVAESVARHAAGEVAARLVEAGVLPASAVGWAGEVARSEPVRVVVEFAGSAGLADLAGRGAYGAASWAAGTELGRALTEMAEEVARTTLRERMKDSARESVRLAWTGAVGVLRGDPVPATGPVTRATRKITELVVRGPAGEAAAAIAVRVTLRTAPAAVPRLAASAARSSTQRALRLLGPAGDR
ncbi:hypothetical protein EDD29_6050 [Actinocorallia herbida]|uniref:Uncharacterized protein n=1 Tax=Actinocorallia herbida TaxID=58109 RepID=A0A3N1D4C6_9ACTN|nr:hypothetical protein [Actinocorallia herbida]ROO88381.1 hypothetical protein EDD29_6050 [Actinocorallia herbida]